MRALRRAGCARGFILVEILVAVVLLALLVVPLATALSSAGERADAIRLRGIDSCALTAATPSAEAWEWGPGVASVRWGRGPVLHIVVGTPAEAASRVGLWVDGWSLGEREPDMDGGVHVGASEWRDLVGGELVVRVRAQEGVWGPPWRSIVPDADGDEALSRATGQPATAGDGLATGVETVVHVPGAANPPLETLQDGVLLEREPCGLVFNVAPADPGRCDVRLDGAIQSWSGEDGRALDVYF